MISRNKADASAWTARRKVTWLFVSACTAGGTEPLAVEVANSLLVLLRRKRLLAEERDRALNAFGRLPLVDDVGCRLAFARTSELAVEHGLSVYEDAYLELAIRRKLPLASRDKGPLPRGQGLPRQTAALKEGNRVAAPASFAFDNRTE